MPQVSFLDLKAQYLTIADEVQTALREVCESCRFALGPAVESFERAFAAYCEARHCVAVNSGTSALHLTLDALDVGPGDEVITVPMTFVATAWAISYTGATPVFVDIDPATRTLDAAQLEAAITPRTRAILPVHLYGQPAEMGPILQIARKHKLPVIEDAAQAHGARYRGRRVGAIGKAGCFSFYPGKNLGAYGEGGAIVTDDDALAERARMLRDHGQRTKHCHEEIGYNYRMEAMQGAVLDIKLRRLEDWNDARRRHARQYLTELQGIAGLDLPATYEDLESVYHLFVVEHDRRDWLAAELAKRGIQTALHYPVCVHRQPAYAHLGLPEGRFPHAERLGRRCLSLPMYAELPGEHIHQVAEAIRELLGSEAGDDTNRLKADLAEACV